MTARLLGGRWLCGAVAYLVADEFVWAAKCRCPNCRRTTGSTFRPCARIERGKLAVTRGADRVLRHGRQETHDAHRGACGLLLFSQLNGRAFANVAMGKPVDAPSIRPSGHIFAGCKAAWHEITEDLPRHETFPR